LFKGLTNKHLDDATVNLKISSKLPIFFVAASSRRIMGSEILSRSLFREKFIKATGQASIKQNQPRQIYLPKIPPVT
jgi:hypothetical protein